MINLSLELWQFFALSDQRGQLNRKLRFESEKPLITVTFWVKIPTSFPKIADWQHFSFKKVTVKFLQHTKQEQSLYTFPILD